MPMGSNGPLTQAPSPLPRRRRRCQKSQPIHLTYGRNHEQPSPRPGRLLQMGKSVPLPGTATVTT